MTSLAALGAALLPVTATAQDIPEEEMVDLGSLGGDLSIATQVNSNGSTVFGYAADENGGVHMVLWQDGVAIDITPPGVVYGIGLLSGRSTESGLLSLDGSTVVIRTLVDGLYRYRDGTATRIDQPAAPGGLSFDSVTGLDRDGSTLVGFSYFDGAQHAMRWTEEGVQEISPAGSTSSSALAVNGDGSVVVGTFDSGGGQEAFRWSDGTAQALGALPGQISSIANLISDDGRIVAGSARVSDGTGGGNARVFVWQDGTMSDIGDLGGATVYAKAMSSDGSTIIGQSAHNNPGVANVSQAYYWRGGVMREVGYLPTDNPLGAFTVAQAVSGDGSVIVGSARGATGNSEVAFRWTEESGIVSLGTLGGESSKALDVSEDGTTIVGLADNAQGQSRAFIWRSVMQDFTNMLASFGGLAEESELAIEEQRHLAEIAAVPGCDPSARRFCVGLQGFGWTIASGARSGRRGGAGAGLFARLALANRLSIGGGFAWADPAIEGDRAHETGARAWSVSLDYGAADAGPFGRIWYSQAREDLSLVRGEGYADVQAMSAETRLASESYGLRAGYGLVLSGGVSLRPWVRLARHKSDRDGFVETGGDFPARFAAIQANRTTAAIGFDLSPSAQSLPIRVNLSLETDLDNDPIAISGTSDIPGMEAFNLMSSLTRKEVRARIGAEYDVPLGPLMIGIGANVNSPVYGNSWQLGGALSLSASF